MFSLVPQFRAISHGLYGTQDYHRSVRQKAVEYMQQHREDYSSFLGENMDDYLESMELPGTWGDELTLVHCLDLQNLCSSAFTLKRPKAILEA